MCIVYCYQYPIVNNIGTYKVVQRQRDIVVDTVTMVTTLNSSYTSNSYMI